MRRGLLAVLAVAAVLAAWLASSAIALKTPTVASVTRTATANDQTLVEAKCPKGKGPVSGGYELDGSDTLAFNSAEGIDLDLKRWSLTTIATPNAARATSFAYCAGLGRKVKFRSDRIDLDPGDSATITATCKRDEKVLSGGYAFVSSELAVGLVGESFRADSRSWSIQGTSFADDQTVTLIAFAHCAPKQKVPQVTTARGVVRFNDEGPTTATADCPSHRYALAGGFQIPDNLPEVVDESQRIGTGGWRVTAHGISGRDDDLTALAYCAPK
jgi:hypothetical protein